MLIIIITETNLVTLILIIWRRISDNPTLLENFSFYYQTPKINMNSEEVGPIKQQQQQQQQQQSSSTTPKYSKDISRKSVNVENISNSEVNVTPIKVMKTPSKDNMNNKNQTQSDSSSYQMDILTALIPMLREPRIGPFTREAILVSSF